MLSVLFSWIAGGAIAVLAGLSLVVAYWRRKRLRAAERAIVKISHISDNGPALHWTGDGPFYVAVQIKNFGRTPARVTDVVLACRVLPRGAKPPIPNDVRRDKAAEPMVSLAANDAFQRTFFLEISSAERVGVYAKTSILFVYGYVDYRDGFGQRHRGGYVRCYDPDVTPDNLALPREPGLDLDIRRTRGQGVDWA